MKKDRVFSLSQINILKDRFEVFLIPNSIPIIGRRRSNRYLKKTSSSFLSATST